MQDLTEKSEIFNYLIEKDALNGNRLYKGLLRKAIQYSGKYQDAEDIVNETYVSAIENSDKLRCEFDKSTEILEHPQLRNWMYKILRNKFFDLYRDKNNLDHLLSDNIPDYSQTSFENVYKKEMKEKVIASLDILSEIYRTPLLMFYINHMSYQKIAENLGIPKGTIKRQIHVAKKKLGAFLIDEDFIKEYFDAA